MDVNLFSKCIKDLILENDRVEVPYLGVFTAEMQPAGYSDKQTTINPPYRKMSFHKEEVSLDQGRLLLGKVMRESGVSLEQAGVELGWCLSRLSSELEGRKSCKLPGLGMMKANTRNEFFFVPDDDLDIWPDGVGFEPISIRVSENPVQLPEEAVEVKEEAVQVTIEETVAAPTPVPEEVTVPEAAPVSEEVQVPEAAPVPEEAPATEVTPDAGEVPAPEAAPAPEALAQQPVRQADQGISKHRPDGGKHRHHGSSSSRSARHRALWITLIVVAVLFALFAVASYLFTEQMSPVLDRLLYNKEELELLRNFGGR